MAVQNPTCVVTINGVTIPQSLVYVQTHKILTTMIGDCDIEIANKLDQFPRTLFPPHSGITVVMNGGVVFTGYSSAPESKYNVNSDEMTTIVRGKDYGEDFKNTQIRKAYLTTPYTTIAQDIINQVNTEQGTSYTLKVTANNDLNNIPLYYPIHNVDAMNSLRNLAGEIVVNKTQYDWFVSNDKTVYFFLRESKPGALTIPMTWGENFVSFDTTDDVDKMRNDIKRFGGQVQTPDYNVPNQIPSTPFLEADMSDSAHITTYGRRQDFQDYQQKKNQNDLMQLAQNALDFENTIEEKTTAVIVGDPNPSPGDMLQVNTPWNSINGTYYIYEVTQMFDGRSDKYTTQLAVGTDIIKFTSASARLSNRLDQLTEKLRFDTKLNFSWSGTGVSYDNTSKPTYLVNPMYSLLAYDFSSLLAYKICNPTTPPTPGDGIYTVVNPIGNPELISPSQFQVYTSAVIPAAWSLSHLFSGIASQSVAQKIMLSNSTDSLIVDVYVKSVGSPDRQLVVALFSDSSGLPGTPIQSVEFNPQDISSTPLYINAFFTALGPDTTYWVVIYENTTNSSGQVVGLSSADPSANYYQLYGQSSLGIPNNTYSGAAAGSNDCDVQGNPLHWTLFSQGGTARTAAAFSRLAITFTYEVEHPVSFFGLSISAQVSTANNIQVPASPAMYPMNTSSTGSAEVLISVPAMCDINGQIATLLSSNKPLAHFNYVGSFSKTPF